MSEKLFGKLISRFSLLLFISLILTACGGGDGKTPTGSTPASPLPATTSTTGIQTIAGTVASGAPLVGANIAIKDSAGGTANGLSGTGGVFSIAVTGMKPPFMLVAVVAGQANLYSILPAMDMSSVNTQHVNITPVTTLVLYELNGGADPASMYTGGSFSTATAANVSAKETIVRSKLPTNTVNPIFSMMYGSFAATGAQDSTGYDTALDGLGRITGITSSGVTFSIAPAYIAAAGGGAIITTAAPTIALALTDTTWPFASRNSIATTNPARVTATVKNANGAAVSGAIVTFSTSDPRDSFSGGANTALTDTNGVAWVTLTTSNTAGGASTVTANSTVNGTSAANSLNYSIGASSITLSTISLPAVAISAYGTASISVNVLINGAPYNTPMTVRFTSACASTGKATLTSSVTSVNGTATATYLDNGCNNTNPGDTITATLMNGITVSGYLAVSSPNIGSIQFVSAVTSPPTTPVMITLKGTGGINRSETARVTFRVVDSSGNPVGNALVNFSLNTAPGGLTLSPASAFSDPVTGYVSTNVQSGTMSTVVRVTATTPGTAGAIISTQSDLLVISTGIPAQDGFSLSATSHNIEGWDWDGVTTTLTARLADHFHNPVPDGTAVYFTSEGGSITPSCTTVGGTCSAMLTSQALRPANGRVTVLARAIGEETFIDLNSNGTADSSAEMIDANGHSTDIGYAYIDYNENGIRDADEPYFDFNGSGSYLGTPFTGTGAFAPLNYVGAPARGDGLYHGLLCTAGAAICSAQKSIDVRSSQVIVFSSSEALITINGGVGIVLPPCLMMTPNTGQNGSPYTFTVTVTDLNGNSMPVGTTVSFAATNGKINSNGNFVVQDTIACNASATDCPASSATTNLGNILVTMQSDGFFTPAVAEIIGPPSSPAIPARCNNVMQNGTLTVTVTSPKGVISTATASVSD